MWQRGELLEFIKKNRYARTFLKIRFQVLGPLQAVTKTQPYLDLFYRRQLCNLNSTLPSHDDMFTFQFMYPDSYFLGYMSSPPPLLLSGSAENCPIRLKRLRLDGWNIGPSQFNIKTSKYLADQQNLNHFVNWS